MKQTKITIDNLLKIVRIKVIVVVTESD